MVIVLNESLLHQNGQDVGCRLVPVITMMALWNFSLINTFAGWGNLSAGIGLEILLIFLVHFFIY